MAKVDPNLQKQVIKLGYTASQEELARVERETEIERTWWSARPSYASYQSILDDVAAGAATKVIGTKNYLPAMRFRNEKLNEQYPPYLESGTKKLLDELTTEWRVRMDAANLDSQIRLAIASLTIAEGYQKQLASSGKLAILGNPHVRGVAFDIDASAYYFGETPVNDRSPVKDEYDKRFTDAGAAAYVPKYHNFDKHLTREPLEILLDVLRDKKLNNELNFVHEYPGTNNASYHVCRNPEYHPKG